MDDSVEVRWDRAYPYFSSPGRGVKHRRLMEKVHAAYRSSAMKLRAFDRPDEAVLVEGFAARTRFDLERPELVRRLQSILDPLVGTSRLDELLDRALEAAMSLLAADRGNIQLVKTADSGLRIVTQHGFGPAFLEHFAVVDHGTACGRAASSRSQTVIVDVNEDVGFTPHRGIAAASGFRAVQSTPLVDRSGVLIGVFSTHYPRPFAPSALDLEMARRYGERLGELIALRQGDKGRAGNPTAVSSEVVRPS